MATKILAFAGSSRRDSFNKKLVAIATTGAERQGAEVTRVDLADYPMPLFNQDLEAAEGLPETARAFKALMVDHDGLLIASPEYNSAFSPLLKNTLDWASRSESDSEAPLAAFQGKVAAIMATSPGGLGGLRGLVFLRMLLGNLGITVLPDQQAIPQAFQAFDERGALRDEKRHAAVTALGSKLAQTLTALGH